MIHFMLAHNPVSGALDPDSGLSHWRSVHGGIIHDYEPCAA
jgi:hypothetical protein